MNRSQYGAALVTTIVVGLASHLVRHRLPMPLSDVVPDALCGIAVYWLVCFAAPSQTAIFAAFAALVVSACVEFFKLYDPPPVHAFRYTLLGGLLLGHIYTPLKIVWYALGILAGTAIRSRIERRIADRTTPGARM